MTGDPAGNTAAWSCESRTHFSTVEEPVVVPDITMLVPMSAFRVTVAPLEEAVREMPFEV